MAGAWAFRKGEVIESTTERRRGLIPEDLMNFRWLEEIALAPDGSMVAYSVREPDAAANGYRVQLYLRRIGDRATQRLSGGDCRVSALAWSRDSAQLAWCQRDGKGCSLRIWRKAEAVNCVIPLGDEPLAELDWSPDGIHLAGARWTPMLHPRDRRGPKPGVPAPTIKVLRRLRYKRDGIGWVHDRYQQIVVLDTGTGELAQVDAQRVRLFVAEVEPGRDAPRLCRHGARAGHPGRPGTDLPV